MSRLLRALQAGGCTAPVAKNQWGVWRKTDRRGRTIGALDAAQVEVLRLRGKLVRLGGCEDERLVWSGAAENTSFPTPSAAALQRDDTVNRHRQSLLQRVIAAAQDDRQRRAWSMAAQAFLFDLELVQRGGQGTGMNWRAMAAGTRVSGGPVKSYAGLSLRAADASGRLQKVQACLGVDGIRFLDRLLVQERSMTAIAAWRGQTGEQVERAAIQILNKLGGLYSLEIRMPMQAYSPRP